MLWLTLQQLKSKSARTRKSAIQKLKSSGDPDVIDPLSDCLKDDEALVRRAAAEALGEFKDERALNSLVLALNDSSSEVREAAAGSLKKLGDLRAINPLLGVLRDPNSHVRYRAAQALKALGWQPRNDDSGTSFFVALGELEMAAFMGAPAVEPLVALLKEGAYEKRVAAIELLSQIDDARVVKPLLEALTDADSLVRTAAANALERVGDARSVEPLIAALTDSGHNVRAAAALALSKVGDERVISPLIKTLNDHHWEVRAATVEALAKLRDQSSVEPIIALLRDPDKEVRENAAEALGNLGDERAVEALVLALKDEQGAVRQAASRALRRVDPYWERSEAAGRALPEIRAALEHTDYAVQVAAAEILKALGDAPAATRQLATVSDGASHKRSSAADLLVSMLDDFDPDLRQAAAESLGRLGDPRAVEPLARALDDGSRWVRQSAAKALESMRWQPADALQRARHLVVRERWDEAATLGEAAVGPLVKAIASGNSGTRIAAIGALTRTQDSQAGAAISGLLRDKHQAVRRAAAEALRSLGAQPSDPDLLVLCAIELRDWQTVAGQGVSAVEPLIALLQAHEDEPEVIDAAAQTLSFITDPQAATFLLSHAQEGKVSTSVATALSQMLQQNGSQISEPDLQQIAALPDLPRFTYEFNPAQRSYTRLGVEELDCSALRQLAEQELKRRSGRDSAGRESAWDKT